MIYKRQSGYHLTLIARIGAPLRVLDEIETREALAFKGLIDAIRAMFATGCTMPSRHHHSVPVPGDEDATLLIMPAWLSGHYIGVKTVSVFPGNAMRSLPAIFGSYLLSSGKTGQLLAILDGAELTARRTAATSALAASYLARKDARTLLMVGTGRLAANLIEGHSLHRPIQKVIVWGRDSAKAELIANHAIALGMMAEVSTDLRQSVGEADIISCATLSSRPLIFGDWLRPGTHMDLVGAFKPTMRESDDLAIRRSCIFVDTRIGAMTEGGDITQPLHAGIIKPEDILADLTDLVTARHPGRSSQDEITLFKSVGAALEDLAAAIFAFEQLDPAAG